VVAGIMVSQAIFDNGARAAERDFARADVEVAAVALAQDSNDRVRRRWTCI
jgi:outer membrane protein, adhesin transport system